MTNMGIMKTVRCLGISALIALTSVQVGHAALQGFEPGDPAFSTIGDAGTKSTFQGVAPTQGANQLLLTTINTAGQDGTDGYSNQSNSNAVINSALQAFFPVSGLLGTEGSGLKLTFTIGAGQTQSFDYDFLTTEFGPGSHQDFAFAVVLDSANNLVGGIRTVASPSSINFGDSSRQLPVGPIGTNPFSFHTGYQTFSISGLAAGTYTLGLGIEDRTTTDNPSGLLVDNIQIVPEPSTLGLIAIGAAGLLAARRRVRR